MPLGTPEPPEVEPSAAKVPLAGPWLDANTALGEPGAPNCGAPKLIEGTTGSAKVLLAAPEFPRLGAAPDRGAPARAPKLPLPLLLELLLPEPVCVPDPLLEAGVPHPAAHRAAIVKLEATDNCAYFV